MWNSGTTGNLLYFSYVFVHSLYRFKMLLTIELFVAVPKEIMIAKRGGGWGV